MAWPGMVAAMAARRGDKHAAALLKVVAVRRLLGASPAAQLPAGVAVGPAPAVAAVLPAPGDNCCSTQSDLAWRATAAALLEAVALQPDAAEPLVPDILKPAAPFLERLNDDIGSYLHSEFDVTAGSCGGGSGSGGSSSGGGGGCQILTSSGSSGAARASAAPQTVAATADGPAAACSSAVAGVSSLLQIPQSQLPADSAASLAAGRAVSSMHESTVQRLGAVPPQRAAALLPPLMRMLSRHLVADTLRWADSRRQALRWGSRDCCGKCCMLGTQHIRLQRFWPCSGCSRAAMSVPTSCIRWRT